MSNTEKPLSAVNAGGTWQNLNDGLSNALNLWGRVEQIKRQKSASGQDQLQAMYKPPMANGAAVQLDQNLTQKKDTGFKVDKPILYASFGLLGLVFLLKMKGFS